MVQANAEVERVCRHMYGHLNGTCGYLSIPYLFGGQLEGQTVRVGMANPINPPALQVVNRIARMKRQDCFIMVFNSRKVVPNHWNKFTGCVFPPKRVK